MDNSTKQRKVLGLKLGNNHSDKSNNHTNDTQQTFTNDAQSNNQNNFESSNIDSGSRFAGNQFNKRQRYNQQSSQSSVVIIKKSTSKYNDAGKFDTFIDQEKNEKTYILEDDIDHHNIPNKIIINNNLVINNIKESNISKTLKDPNSNINNSDNADNRDSSNGKNNANNNTDINDITNSTFESPKIKYNIKVNTTNATNATNEVNNNTSTINTSRNLLYARNKVKNLDILYSASDKSKNNGANVKNNAADDKNNKKNTNAANTDAASTKVHKFGFDALEDNYEANEKSKLDKKASKNLKEDVVIVTEGIGRVGRKLSAAQLALIDSDKEDSNDNDGDNNSDNNKNNYSGKNSKYSKGSRQVYSRKRKSKNLFKNTVNEKIFKEVIIPDFITVQELASRMSEKATNVIKELMKLNIMATINQAIDADVAELIVLELGHKAKRVTTDEIIKQLIGSKEYKAEDMKIKAPVVTIMGHVDHGKTSLLDVLRSTDVTASESGGITQHIGAYKVTMPSGKFITFLDTPGHEAFTAMRMRGAKITDIVVLVVAADDGIKAQTIEAIHHAKAAEVPIIVAINKIDKEGANIDKVKNTLLSYELVPEDMGGDVMVVPVSAHKKLGLNQLEEAILIQAELLDLKAVYDKPATGSVIEAKVDKNKGVSVTFLIQSGTLKVGDMVIAGCVSGRVRSMHDDKGHTIKEATPSVPVEIFGLNFPPVAGDEFIVLNDEKKAKELLQFKIQKEKERKTACISENKLSIDQLFINAKSNIKELIVIIKADVQGSAEAIVHSLQKFDYNEVKLKILHDAVGGITESDISLAAVSRALVIGFNVRTNNNAKEMAKKLGVEIRYYTIIYDIIDDVKIIMSGLLKPIKKDKILGYAEVRHVFNLTKYGKIAGCYVTEGTIKRGAYVRLLRNNIVIYDGKMKSLKHGKEDVREAKFGFECGIGIEGHDDIREMDVIEVFDVVEEGRKLE